MTQVPLLEPSTALVAYAEAIVEGGRVLVIGNALSRVSAQLLARGARFIYVSDVDPARVAAAASKNSSRDVTYATLTEGSLALREGAFDVAIVENLGAVGDIVGVLKGVERALGPKGVAIIASPNPEATLHLLGRHDPSALALDYYSLYDAVAAQFRVVRMFGQAPFVGYAIVDFAPSGEPQPSIDTGFLPGGAEDPEWFIALGSQHKVDFDDFTVVQIGFKDAWQAFTNLEQTKSGSKLEMRPHRHPARTLPRGSEGRSESLERQALEMELAKRDAWITQLENRASVADARADETQSELDDLQETVTTERVAANTALEHAKEQQKLAERQLQDLDGQHLAEATALKSEITRLTAARVELAHELSTVKAQVAALAARVQEQASTLETPSDQNTELHALEVQLSERGQLIQQLEHDLRMAEQVGRELISELKEHPQNPEWLSAPPGSDARVAPEVPAASDLRQLLDALAATNALQQADLAAAEWRVQDLENRLTLGGQPASQS